MKIFNLGNGHTLEVEKANRGIEDDYMEGGFYGRIKKESYRKIRK